MEYIFLHDSPLPSVASTLTGAYNRAYRASALRAFVQIPRFRLGTSDMRQPLYEMFERRQWL